MKVRIFDKSKQFSPKETISYITNSKGELELVRTKVVAMADPKRVAKDFIAQQRIRGHTISYYNGIEIDVDDASDLIDKLDLAGFDYEADGLTLKEFSDEIGVPEHEIISMSNKVLSCGSRLKKKSVLDQYSAESLRSAFKASKNQRHRSR